MARKIHPQEACLFCDAYPCVCGQPAAPALSVTAPAPAPGAVPAPAPPSAPVSAPEPTTAPAAPPAPSEPPASPQPAAVTVYLPRNDGSPIDEAFERILMTAFPGAKMVQS